MMRRSLAAALAVFALAGAACADDGVEEAQAAKVEKLGENLVPGEMLGLRVATEDIGPVQRVKRPYVEAVGLYSLREGEQLQGTLQVSRFTEAAEAEKARFRNSVVQQIGSTVPRQLSMGGEQVWLTTGRRQSVAVWFKGRHVFVLATREEYTTPRSLLRKALEIEP